MRKAFCAREYPPPASADTVPELALAAAWVVHDCTVRAERYGRPLCCVVPGPAQVAGRREADRDLMHVAGKVLRWLPPD